MVASGHLEGKITGCLCEESKMPPQRHQTVPAATLGRPQDHRPNETENLRSMQLMELKRPLGNSKGPRTDSLGEGCVRQEKDPPRAQAQLGGEARAV